MRLFKKINELTFKFNLRYFCFPVKYLTLTELKNCLKLLSELTFNEVNVSINLPNTGFSISLNYKK